MKVGYRIAKNLSIILFYLCFFAFAQNETTASKQFNLQGISYKTPRYILRLIPQFDIYESVIQVEMEVRKMPNSSISALSLQLIGKNSREQTDIAADLNTYVKLEGSPNREQITATANLVGYFMYENNSKNYLLLSDLKNSVVAGPYYVKEKSHVKHYYGNVSLLKNFLISHFNFEPGTEEWNATRTEIEAHAGKEFMLYLPRARRYVKLHIKKDQMNRGTADKEEKILNQGLAREKKTFEVPQFKDLESIKDYFGSNKIVLVEGFKVDSWDEINKTVHDNPLRDVLISVITTGSGELESFIVQPNFTKGIECSVYPKEDALKGNLMVNCSVPLSYGQAYTTKYNFEFFNPTVKKWITINLDGKEDTTSVRYQAYRVGNSNQLILIGTGNEQKLKGEYQLKVEVTNKENGKTEIYLSDKFVVDQLGSMIVGQAITQLFIAFMTQLSAILGVFSVRIMINSCKDLSLK